MLAALLSLAALASRGIAVQPGEVRIRYGLYAPQPPPISAEANLVEVAVTVLDAHGRPAGGFSRDDFRILDNGHLQPVTFFSELKAAAPSPQDSPGAAFESSAPSRQPAARFIALFVDDTHINQFGLGKARAAATRFIQDRMLPQDRVALFTGSGAVTVDFTADRQALLAGLRRLIMHPQRGDRGLTVCPVLSTYDAYVITRHLDEALRQTRIAEAIACNCISPDPKCVNEQPAYVQTLAETTWAMLHYESTDTLDALSAIVRRLAAMPGTRILTMLSPGFPAGGLEQKLNSVIDAALRARIAINALDSEGLTTQSGPRKRILGAVLAETTSATGGQFLKNTNDLTGALADLNAAPRVSYLLGFSPPAPDGTYHHLSVKLPDRAGFHLETRPGYFAAAPQHVETARARIDREVLSRDRIDGVPVSVRVAALLRHDGRYSIDVRLSIDAAHLKFARKEKRRVQELTFASVLEDAGGDYIAGKLAVMDLALTPPSLAEFQSKGIHAALTFDAPKGSYLLRLVVREAVDNHLSASTTPIAIP